MSKQFRDRVDAGQQLAARLVRYANRPDVLVLALPRGGVPVAYEVARTLNVALDVLLVRKLSLPGFQELAFGAITSGGILVLNPEIVQELEIDRLEVERLATQARRTMDRRERIFRGDRPNPEIEGRTIIVVDDGLATGATVRAAVRALRVKAPARILLAVPVAPRETCDELQPEVDELVCLITPRNFYAVSLWYENFTQTTDAEVRELLAQRASELPQNVGELLAG